MKRTGKNPQLLFAAPVLVLALCMVGCPLRPCTEDPVEGLYINIQVDGEEEDTAGLARIINTLSQRNMPATVYVTADYANRNASSIQKLYKQGFEIALHGYYTGEQLASMTYEAQLDLLTRAKTALEGCQPCGTYIPINGFRPQYFSQNEDTFKVLDELGFTYNSGFKAKQLFAEGHDNDDAPYPMPNHNFYALPISTTEYNGQLVYLCDIGCALGNLQMTGAQWSQLLQDALAQAEANHRPLVVLVHGWYTGDKTEYDYWQPFIDFLDAARCKGTFVTSQELVDLFTVE